MIACSSNWPGNEASLYLLLSGLSYCWIFLTSIFDISIPTQDVKDCDPNITSLYLEVRNRVDTSEVPGKIPFPYRGGKTSPAGLIFAGPLFGDQVMNIQKLCMRVYIVRI